MFYGKLSSTTYNWYVLSATGWEKHWAIRNFYVDQIPIERYNVRAHLGFHLTPVN